MSQEKTPAKKTPAKKKTSVKASERRKRASARAAAGLPKGPNGKAGQAERQQKYLDAREEGRFMYQAAADAGVTRTCVHHWRNCPYQGEEFRARELRAREVGVDRIKDAVRQIMEETASDNQAVAIRAAETLLIDRAEAQAFVVPLVKALQDAGCEVRGDAQVCAMAQSVVPASQADWSTEYGDAILSVGLVDGVEGALAHIARYGSSHTESIVTRDDAAAARFLQACDSAIVMHNASTQFADGGEFGMGAEIGIATGRMHARGPIGLEQLTSFHYLVRGTGQIRPV